MSVVPLLFDLDPWETYGSIYNYRDPLSFGVSPRSVSQLLSVPRWANSLLRQSASDTCSSLVGKDGFQACIDVQQFKPNEITVKTIDNTVIIEGKHEERQDEHGNIYRHFVRKYELPEGYDAKEVVSTLSSDGILTVKAPPPPDNTLKGNERIVQIQQTGPAHLNVSENPADGTDSKKKKLNKLSSID